MNFNNRRAARLRTATFNCSTLGYAVFAVALLIHLAGATPASANNEVRVQVGKSTVLEFPEKIETVSLADENVADVIAITATELVVIGKSVGTTTLAVWWTSGRHESYDVRVIRNFSGQQVLLKVQIGELNTSTFKELGFDFLWDNRQLSEGDIRVGTFGGRVSSPSVPLQMSEGVSGLFQFIGRENDITAIVHALQEKGVLRMLAKPQMLALSGETAEFLSGGEIPIPIAQVGTAGASTITIQWKEYGVRLKFVPTVVDSNLINLEVSPEVSSLDFTNSVIIGGFAVPALLTRRMKTTVELHSGEAMFLGGLITQQRVTSQKRIPILGHIPLLGALFTRTENSTHESELVIIVSPSIVDPNRLEPIPDMPWGGLSEPVPDTTQTVPVDRNE